MEYGEKFKKSIFGGFDRQDVLRCLEEMQQQSHAEIEKLRIEMESIRQERDTLRLRFGEQELLLREQTDTLARTEESVAAMTTACREAETRCESLQKELSTQKALSSELLMKKNVLEENCRRLTVRVQELEEKNNERAALALGELMVEAKVNAGRIEEEARQRAAESDAVLTARCEEADRRLEDLKARVGRTMDTLRALCDAAVADMEQLNDQLEDCRTAVRETIPAPAEIAETNDAPSEEQKSETSSAEENAASFQD